MRIFKFFTPLLFFQSPASLAWEPLTYVVRKGDTLSTIAQVQIGSPVYPADGSLAQLLELNPQLTDKNLIRPGQKLQLRLPKKANAFRGMASTQPPAIEVTPPTSAKKIVTSADEPGHQLDLSIGSSLTTLAAEDGTTNTDAKLLTSYDVRVVAAWSQNWTPSFATSFGGSLRTLDFQPSTNKNKSLTKTKQVLTGLSLQATQRLSRSVDLSLTAAYDKELFMEGLDSATVQIDSLAIPSFGIGTHVRLYHKGRTSTGFNAQALTLFQTSTDGYTVQQGFAYGASVYLMRSYHQSNELRLQVGFQKRHQKTSLVDIDETNVFGELTFSLPLFDGGDVK